MIEIFERNVCLFKTGKAEIKNAEAVLWRCSVEKVFLEISPNLQENACASVSFLIRLQAWGPVSTVICSLPPFFRKKNVSFGKNFGARPTVFPLFTGAMAYLTPTRAPGLVSGAVVNLAPISLVNMASPHTTLNTEFLFDKSSNF